MFWEERGVLITVEWRLTNRIEVRAAAVRVCTENLACVGSTELWSCGS